MLFILMIITAFLLGAWLMSCHQKARATLDDSFVTQVRDDDSTDYESSVIEGKCEICPVKNT
jgi:hypothetical protein